MLLGRVSGGWRGLWGRRRARDVCEMDECGLGMYCNYYRCRVEDAMLDPITQIMLIRSFRSITRPFHPMLIYLEFRLRETPCKCDADDASI